MRIDLHMHSTVSDGTDTPRQILENVKKENMEVFSLTDHDDVLGCEMIEAFHSEDDPAFICGIELSTQYGHNKYHILGYAYDTHNKSLSTLCRQVHDSRMRKLEGRLRELENVHHITFPDEDVSKLYRLPNPGKPHLANLLVKYGYSDSITEAIDGILSTYRSNIPDITPHEAIQTILDCDGIPVLAHGLFGDGQQHLSEQELDERVMYLKDLGLMGMETYYSRYTPEEQAFTLRIADKYNLLHTAGSDYHGTNKKVRIGENHILNAEEDPKIMEFLHDAENKRNSR